MKRYLLLSAFFVLVQIFNIPISQASEFNIYVDQKSQSSDPDGSKDSPFRNINDAIKDAKSKPADQRSIFIANGNYTEKLVIDDSMTLTGENKDSTIIDGGDSRRAIEINATSTLSNLHIIGGTTGIFVSKNAGSKILSSKIEKNKKIGIEIEPSSTDNSKKVTVSKSTISNSLGKGFYVQKRLIAIENNTVSNNKEEGIDLRAGAKGSIKKNTISKNGESGIELVVGNSSLNISSNKITNNSASGIANQFYKQSKSLGNINVTKNKILNNSNYGVKCGAPSGGTTPENYWTKSIKLSNNTFAGRKDLAGRCNFQTGIRL